MKSQKNQSIRAKNMYMSQTYIPPDDVVRFPYKQVQLYI